MTRITTINCDVCHEEIEQCPEPIEHINAQTFGVDIHVACARALNGIQMMTVLGLDDITWMGKKICYNKDPLVYTPIQR